MLRIILYGSYLINYTSDSQNLYLVQRYKLQGHSIAKDQVLSSLIKYNHFIAANDPYKHSLDQRNYIRS